MKRAWIAALLAAACGHTAPPPAQPTPDDHPSVKSQIEGQDDDQPAPSKPDEGALQIAAIERAMNVLAPVANQCWAAAAASDFHVAGTLKMTISFDGAGRTTAVATDDGVHNAVLSDCLARVLTAYAWPKDIMSGQAVELPFAFTAPTGQNTIDRRLVPGVVKVLIDAQNSGNAAASMIELAIDPGAAKAPAIASRDEIVIFLDDGKLGGTPMHALDAAYVAKGHTYALAAGEGGSPTRVLVVAVPGGNEVVARGGMLPDLPAVSRAKIRPPEFHAKAKATRYPRTGGATTILIENAPHAASLGVLEVDAGAKVPTHVHEHETELLYLLAGSGTMTIDGVDMPIGPTTVVQIPPNTPHSFAAAEAVTAIQLYAPPGPEQRFKKMK